MDVKKLSFEMYDKLMEKKDIRVRNLEKNGVIFSSSERGLYNMAYNQGINDAISELETTLKEIL